MTMTDYKTFGEMSKEEQLALFVAWQEGKTIERLNLANVWEANEGPHATFWIDNCHRIAVPKPFFDFSTFDDEWDHAAINQDRHVFLHKGKPTMKTSGFWCPVNNRENNRIRICKGMLSPSVTNLFDHSIPWQESLVAREGVECGKP